MHLLGRALCLFNCLAALSAALPVDEQRRDQVDDVLYGPSSLHERQDGSMTIVQWVEANSQNASSKKTKRQQPECPLTQQSGLLSYDMAAEEDDDDLTIVIASDVLVDDVLGPYEKYLKVGVRTGETIENATWEDIVDDLKGQDGAYVTSHTLSIAENLLNDMGPFFDNDVLCEPPPNEKLGGSRKILTTELGPRITGYLLKAAIGGPIAAAWKYGDATNVANKSVAVQAVYAGATAITLLAVNEVVDYIRDKGGLTQLNNNIVNAFLAVVTAAFEAFKNAWQGTCIALADLNPILPFVQFYDNLQLRLASLFLQGQCPNPQADPNGNPKLKMM